MRNVLKSIIKVAVVAVILFVPGFSILSVLLLGYAGSKVVDALSDGISALTQSGKTDTNGLTREQKRRNRASHRAKVRKDFVAYDFDEKLGRPVKRWNLDAFPKDMYPQVGVFSSGMPLKSQFTCGGCENVVTGEYLGTDFWGRDKVRFSMEMSDSDRVQEMSEYIAKHGIVGTQIVRKGDSSFELVSDNAVDMNDLVKEFYPPHTMEVKREVSTTRQYIVSGCNSFEEALQKYEKDKFVLHPAAVTVSYQDTVGDFVQHPVSDGNEYNPALLGVGDYVINVTDKEVYGKKVTFAAGLNETEESMASRAVDALEREPMTREDNLIEHECSAEPVISDGLEGRNPSRCFVSGDHYVPVLDDIDRSIDSLQAKVYVRYENVDDLLSALTGEEPMKGGLVLVDTEPPKAGKDEYIVALPVDSRMLGILDTNKEDLSKTLDRYAFSDISREDISKSCLIDELTRKHYFSAVLSDNPDLQDATVNGVPAQEFIERMDGMVEKDLTDRLDNERQFTAWLDDARRIVAVSMDVDMRNHQVVLSSTIQNNDCSLVETRTETRDLTGEELQDLARRGFVSKAEMKDIVMKLYPTNFYSYSEPDASGVRSSIYEGDPLMDFLRGEKPVRKPAVSVKAPLTETLVEEESQTAGRTVKPSPSKKSVPHF